MKITTLLLLFFLLAFNSCKKNKDADKPKSIVTVLNDGKSYQLEIQERVLKVSTDSAEIRFFASSADMELELHALSLSTNHQAGVGAYFLLCCNNDFWEKFTSAKIGYEGNRPLTDGSKQVGYVNVTKNDSKSYEGEFTVNGRNNEGVSKDISGTFKIYL